jgi:Caspase domain
MARRALLVGIDAYQVFNDLNTCVTDATAMQEMLERNADGSPNYSCRLMVYGHDSGMPEVTRPRLREACQELFDFTGDVLFYFSGHGSLTKVGGYLATCESEADDWGVPMQEIIDLASISPARDILLILDCCHAGAAGSLTIFGRPGDPNPLAVLRENMTVIASSRASESSVEAGKHGLFTASVLDALDGGAADHVGWVTAQSIYAYVERGFSWWTQRPVYKSHATELTVVRRCAPLIEWLKLREIVKHFPTPDYKFRLDPEYEPEDEHGNMHEPVNHEKVALGQLFKEYRDAGLLKSSDGKQLYWAARTGGTLELTLRGREYWRLVKEKRI